MQCKLAWLPIFIWHNYTNLTKNKFDSNPGTVITNTNFSLFFNGNDFRQERVLSCVETMKSKFKIFYQYKERKLQTSNLLTGNRTRDPLVCRPVFNPLSHSSQGKVLNMVIKLRRTHTHIYPYTQCYCDWKCFDSQIDLAVIDIFKY